MACSSAWFGEGGTAGGMTPAVSPHHSVSGSHCHAPRPHGRTGDAAGRPCTHMPTRSGFWTAPTMKS